MQARGSAELLPWLDDSMAGRALRVFAEFALVAGHLQCYPPHWLSVGSADKNVTLPNYSLHWGFAQFQGKGVTFAPEPVCRDLPPDC